jgi:hypothetical protein
LPSCFFVFVLICLPPQLEEEHKLLEEKKRRWIEEEQRATRHEGARVCGTRVCIFGSRCVTQGAKKGKKARATSTFEGSEAEDESSEVTLTSLT